MKRAEFGKEEDESLESLTSKKPTMNPSQPAEPAPASPAVEFIAEHTIGAGETLSHLALKYYGSTAREMWMAIYEANKDVIGSNPNVVRPGTVVKIPKQPKA